MDSLCLFCGGQLMLFGPRLNYEYHICKSCKTIQLLPMPTEENIISAYSTEFSSAKQTEEADDPEWSTATSKPYGKAILQTLIDHKISGRIYDFGAGWGHLCEILIEHGFNCIGTELSFDMANYCQQKRLPVEQGGLELIEKNSNKISAIVMCAVFEHLVNHDSYLTRFNSILPIGGLIVTLHPTSRFYNLIGNLVRLGNRYKELPELHGSFAPPWHTTLFSLDAMEILAQKNGFVVDEIRPAPQGRIGGFIGLIQILLEKVNFIGYSLLGLRWPLITSHIFVLRKVADVHIH